MSNYVPYQPKEWASKEFIKKQDMNHIENGLAEASEEIVNKANIDGYYENLTAGNAEQLISSTSIVDKEPYNFRASGNSADIGNRETDKVIGGTLVWNQLVPNDKHAVSASGNGTKSYIATVTGARAYPKRLYYFRAKCSYASESDDTMGCYMTVGGTTYGTPVGAQVVLADGEMADTAYFYYNDNLAAEGVVCSWGMSSKSGRTQTATDTMSISDAVMFDLTLMFGETISEYLRSLTPTARIAWLQKLFPESSYAYNAGTLMSVNTSAHKMVGFNAYDHAAGTAKLLGGHQYQITGSYTALSYSTGETIAPDSDGLFTPGGNGVLTVTGGSAANTCVHLVWSGIRDGDYEPYAVHNYPLDENLELRGFPQIDANGKLYYNGDVYESSGSVTRRFGIVTANQLNASRITAIVSNENYVSFWLYTPGKKYGGVMCNIMPYYQSPVTSRDKVGLSDGAPAYPTSWLNCLPIAAGTTAESILQYLNDNSVVFIYELAEPTTETAEPYRNLQIGDDFGTEEYIDAGVAAGTRDVAIPVGHETSYMNNLRDKLQHLPSLASTDGNYMITQSAARMSLTPLIIPTGLPEAPTEDGIYTLKATVNEGVVTYNWVLNEG